MKTVQIMEREFMGSVVRQNHKTKFFNATDLVKVGNKYRENSGLSKKDLFQYFDNPSTKEFVKKIMVKEKVADVKQTKRGKNGGTWVHPLIIIDLAMWLSPDFKYEALKWIEDSLLEFRDNSGNSYNKMSSALHRTYEFKEVHYLIKEVAKRIKQVVGAEDWNTATEKQLKDRDKIHNNIIYACKFGVALKKNVRMAIEDVYPDYLKNLREVC